MKFNSYPVQEGLALAERYGSFGKALESMQSIITKPRYPVVWGYCDSFGGSQDLKTIPSLSLYVKNRSNSLIIGLELYIVYTCLDLPKISIFQDFYARAAEVNEVVKYNISDELETSDKGALFSFDLEPLHTYRIQMRFTGYHLHAYPIENIQTLEFRHPNIRLSRRDISVS